MRHFVLILLVGGLAPAGLPAKTPTPIPTTSADGVVVSGVSWLSEDSPGAGWADVLASESGWTNAVIYTLYGNPTGLVNFVPNFSDSQAKSIWFSNSNTPDIAYFRGHFFLGQVPDVAQVRVWADNYFDLYINGALFFRDLVGGSYVLTVDSTWLVPGDNLIAVFGVDNPQAGLPTTQRNAVALDFRYILNATATPSLTPEATLTPSPAAQLAIVKSALPELADIGGTVTYTLAASNTATDKIDVVWVVDSSGSMAPYQQAIATNASSFMGRLAGTDFRVGVVDYCFVPEGGNGAEPLALPMELDGSRHPVQDQGGVFTSIQAEFSTMITAVGDQGSGAEPAFRGLQASLNLNYEFRPDARKVFILLTDEADFDHAYLGDRDPGTGILDETAGLMRQAGAVVYVIGPEPADYDGVPTNHFWDSSGGPYPEAVGIAAATGGAFEDIQTPDWSGLLSSLGLDIAKLTAQGVAVLDGLPPGSTFLSSVPPPSSVTGQDVLWNLGTLGAGQSLSLTLIAVLDGVQGSEFLHNDADLSASNALGGTSNDAAVTVKSATWTLTHTYTNSPSKSWTLSPSPSRTVTPTHSPGPTKTSTESQTPSSSPSFTATEAPSLSGTVSGTATRSASFTHSALPSRTPTVSATFTMSPTISATPTVSLTATESASSTGTSTTSATSTATVSPTLTETPTSSRSESPTSTSSPSPTPTPAPSGSFTPTPTDTSSATTSATATPSPTPSVSSTATLSGTVTASFTISNTPTPSATSSPSATVSDTGTISATPTESATSSPSATVSATPSPSATGGPSLTRSLSPTRSRTGTRTATRTVSPTRTASPAGSPTPSASASPEAYHIEIYVYDSAGERVAVLQAGSAPEPAGAFLLEAQLTQASQPLVFRDQGGGVLAVWNGSLPGGIRASPGVYTASVRSRDDLGHISESFVTFSIAWNDVSPELALDLAPNPAPGAAGFKRELRLSAPGGFHGFVRAYTLAGESVWSRPLNSTGDLVLSLQDPWPAGVYLVLVLGADSQGRPVRLLGKWVIL